MSPTRKPGVIVNELLSFFWCSWFFLWLWTFSKKMLTLLLLECVNWITMSLSKFYNESKRIALSRLALPSSQTFCRSRWSWHHLQIHVSPIRCLASTNIMKGHSCAWSFLGAASRLKISDTHSLRAWNQILETQDTGNPLLQPAAVIRKGELVRIPAYWQMWVDFQSSGCIWKRALILAACHIVILTRSHEADTGRVSRMIEAS